MWNKFTLMLYVRAMNAGDNVQSAYLFIPNRSYGWIRQTESINASIQTELFREAWNTNYKASRIKHFLDSVLTLSTCWQTTAQIRQFLDSVSQGWLIWVLMGISRTIKRSQTAARIHTLNLHQRTSAWFIQLIWTISWTQNYFSQCHTLQHTSMSWVVK